ncbi:MAG: glycosyltransferase [Microcoleaceae cyanobacterium]
MDPPLISFFLPNLGGGGVLRSVVNLAQGCIDQGFKVDILVNRAVGPFLEEVPSQVRVVDLKDPRLRQSISVVANYLRQEQPYGLISNMHYNDEIALLARHFSGVSTKIVVVNKNHPRNRRKKPSIGEFVVKPMYWLGFAPNRPTTLMRLLYPRADGIVAISQGVAENVARVTGLPMNQIRVVYNPVITPELKQKAQEPIDHSWFKPGEPPIILGVGRLTGQKDFPTLIHAFAHVRQQQRVRLLILGSGPDREALEDLVRALDLEEDVSMPGYVNNPYAYMAKSSVFVLSSIWEGLGNVLIEAMAAGVPVVSTDCESGPAEILDQDRYGSLVPVGDAQAMSDAILRTINGKNKEVDSAWLHQFSLEAATQQYLDLIGLGKTAR